MEEWELAGVKRQLYLAAHKFKTAAEILKIHSEVVE